MGTRNLTAVYVDGDFKIAQYGQCDGYPDGQGMTVLRFLRGMNEDTFRHRLSTLRWAAEEEVDAAQAECGGKGGWFGLAEHDEFERRYPQFHRDTAAKILQMVYDGTATALWDDRAFALDGLFCEWAYVIDLDRRTFEVYKGFFKDGQAKGRFAALRDQRAPEDRKYDPVSLVAAWPLDALPDDIEFLMVGVENEED